MKTSFKNTMTLQTLISRIQLVKVNEKYCNMYDVCLF